MNLNQNNDLLELKLTKKDNEMDKLNRKLEDKDIDVKNIKNKNLELKQKIQEQEQKTHGVELELKKFKETIEGYEQDNTGLRKDVSTLEISLNRSKEETHELNEMISKLREQLESKRESFKNTSKMDEDEFEEYKEATEALISNYKQQIEDLETKNSELTSKYDEIQSSIAKEKEREYGSIIRDLKSNNTLLQNSETSLKDSLKQLESKIEELMEEKLDRERGFLDNQSELEGKSKSLETQLGQISTKLKDREEYVKSLESKITRIEEEKIYFMSNEEQQRDELRFEFKTELDELKDKIAELEGQNDDLLVEKDVLQQQLKKEQNLNVNSDDILEGNERMLSQIKKLQSQIIEKDNQIIDLKNEQHSTGKVKNAHASRRDNNKDRQIAELGVENEFLTKQVEELQQRIHKIEQIERKESESSVDDGFLTNIAKANNPELVAQLRRENKDLSEELIKYKTQFAEIEQEKDMKLKDKNEKLKKFSTELTKYEFEMVKAKQSLGEALNQNIELDQYNTELIETIDRYKAQIMEFNSKNDKKKKK